MPHPHRRLPDRGPGELAAAGARLSAPGGCCRHLFGAHRPDGACSLAGVRACACTGWRPLEDHAALDAEIGSSGYPLAEFLLARIAEDKDAARRAAFGYGAGWTSETDDVEDWSVVHADGKRDMVGCEDRDVTGHIARHDPARVLAECEAKRRIVTDATEVPTISARHFLRLLALPYADHPDYREEWRP